MIETYVIAAFFAVCFVAGTVKGVIGLGLPTVTLGIMAVITDVPIAMVLLLVPTFLTNVWQGLVGGHAKVIVRRLWLFMTVATVAVLLGTVVLASVRLEYLSMTLGGLLIVYALVNLFGIRLNVRTKDEIWLGPLLGGISGVLTGMTGSAVVPGVMYMQALGLPRDMLIQSMGILFTLLTVTLAIGLERNNLLTVELGVISALAIIPAILGMMTGQRIRKQLSEARFRKVFFVSLLLLGSYIVLRSLVL